MTLRAETRRHRSAACTDSSRYSSLINQAVTAQPGGPSPPDHTGTWSPIIGPRTMEHLQSQLGATEVKLSTDILDKIDEIVPPG
jgi:aryl-alcohol dehydrogenase-like predicted oxidoreductase